MIQNQETGNAILPAMGARIALDEIKIDRALVAAMETRDRTRSSP